MISYKPLLRTLLERDMKVTDLNGILPTSVTSKFRKNAHVNTATLDKICSFLNCRIQDVIEHIPDSGSDLPAEEKEEK